MKIRWKVLILGLGLPGLALCSLAWWAIHAMKWQADYSIQSNLTLSVAAAERSHAALIEMGRENVMADVVNRALYVDEVLQRIADVTVALANQAAQAFASPQTAQVDYYTWERTPADPDTTSVVRLAPQADPRAALLDINLTAVLDKNFADIRRVNPSIKSIYIGTASGLHRRLPWTSARKDSYDPRERSWYKMAAESRTPGWTELYISASEEVLMITSYAPVIQPDGTVSGVIGLDMALSTINQSLLSASSESASGILLDSSGFVIAEPGIVTQGQRWDQAFKSANWATSDNPTLQQVAMAMEHRETGSMRGRYRDKDVLLAYAPVQSRGWYLCLVMPVQRLVAPAVTTSREITDYAQTARQEMHAIIQRHLLNFLVVLLLALVAFLLLAGGLSNKIVTPLRKLAEGAVRLGKGDFDFRLQFRTGDELEDLAASFNRMSAALRDYMTDLAATTAEKKRIESELHIATVIQAGMLPNIFPPFPNRHEFSIFASMKPAKEVGGDFYDFFFVDEQRFCLLVGDVSGKGVPAALFMAIAKSMLQSSIRSHEDLGRAFGRFNHTLAANNSEMLFVTILVLVIDLQTGEVQYVDAGHNPALITDQESGRYLYFREQATKCIAAGIDEDFAYVTGKLQLRPHDRILLYTDGVTEAFNPGWEEFGEERLEQVVNSCREADPEAVVQQIQRQVESFATGAEQSDDITIVSFLYHGAA